MSWNGAEGLRPLLVPIETLTPDPANARRHDKKNLAAIEASLRSFGQHRAAVAQLRPDGSKVVRVGNGMIEAAKAIGWTEIAALVIEESDEAAVARAVADNRAGELAEWDDDLLVAALRGVPEELRAQVGFNAAELERLLGHAGGLGDADDVPEPPSEPTTRVGDLWLLGEHRLICGSATDPDVVARVLDGAEPRVLLTDPPYGVSLDMEWRDRAGLNGMGPAEPSYLKRRTEGHQNATISGDTRADWSEAFELVPSLDTAYCWHASAYSIEVGLGLRRIGFELKQHLVWVKPHFALSRSNYHWQHEPCWYARKAGAAPFRGSRDQSTVWTAPSPKMLMNPGGGAEEKYDHPTQKPVALYVRPIENHTEKGDFVYEPFSGSGTCVAAAEQTGRRCLAVELDPKYVDVCVERWQRFTGKKAERVPS